MMQVAALTFDRFNELDSFVVAAILERFPTDPSRRGIHTGALI